MPNYIDKDKLKRDLIDNRSFYPAIVKSAIENAPVEDVALKRKIIKQFVRRFESYIGNCTFTMGQTNDIQYALKKATEDIIGE